MKYLVAILLVFNSFLASHSCKNKRDTQHTNKANITMNDSSAYKQKIEILVVELKRFGISDNKILTAIAKVPRQHFVPKELSDRAYDNKPLPIGKGQTISQPYTVAFQTELLQLEPNDKVLEIGTGSGYQAAVLCELGADVYSIERVFDLHINAKNILEKLDYKLNLFYGDGYEGLPDHAPFDKILITAASKEVPQRLLNQLRIGGLMIVPLGDNKGQTMTAIKRTDTDKFSTTKHGEFRFVPMLEGIDE